jgi:hypothetical protein
MRLFFFSRHMCCSLFNTASAEDVVAERRGIKQMIENEKARKEKEKKEKGGGLLPVHR